MTCNFEYENDKRHVFFIQIAFKKPKKPFKCVIEVSVIRKLLKNLSFFLVKHFDRYLVNTLSYRANANYTATI